VQEHPFIWLAGLVVGVVGTIAASLATRVELLPEVVDISFVPTGAGLGGLAGAGFAALRRFPPDRLGRVVLLGNLLGATFAAIVVAAGALGLLS
jgi:hypothetical protein